MVAICTLSIIYLAVFMGVSLYLKRKVIEIERHIDRSKREIIRMRAAADAAACSLRAICNKKKKRH